MDNSVILLSCIGNPLLIPIISACIEPSINIEAIIMDGEVSVRDKEIDKNRLDPTYAQHDLKDINYPDIPFYFIQNHNSADCIALINKLKSHYLLNAGTPRILTKEVLTSKRGVLNCHPGLLPKYRGCTCLEWAIYNDAPIGATVHFMDTGIDEGSIVLKEVMHVPRLQPYEIIRTRIIDFVARLMVKGVIRCFEGKLTPEALPQQGEGKYYKSIPYEKMIQVKQKLCEGRYKSR